MSSCTWPSTPHPAERILQEAPRRAGSFLLWGDPEPRLNGWPLSCLCLHSSLLLSWVWTCFSTGRWTRKASCVHSPTATSVVLLLSRDQENQLCLCAERWLHRKKLCADENEHKWRFSWTLEEKVPLVTTCKDDSTTWRQMDEKTMVKASQWMRKTLHRSEGGGADVCDGMAAENVNGAHANVCTHLPSLRSFSSMFPLSSFLSHLLTPPDWIANP